MTGPRESTIEDYLVKKAEAFGGAALKLRPPTGRGFPDRTLIMPGLWTAFVELKRPKGGRFSVQQEEWEHYLVTKGQRYYRASTLEEVDQIFREYQQEKYYAST